MHASIRRYRLTRGSSPVFNKLIAEGFVPLLKKSPGFVDYYAVDAGNGQWASVSVFTTKEAAEDSNRMAADFVKKNLVGMTAGAPDITSGNVVANGKA